MRVTISKSQALGKVNVPPSKSYAHRYLIAGMFAGEGTTIENVSLSMDITSTINALRALGCDVSYSDHICHFNGFTYQEGKIVIDALESGSTLRFILPIAIQMYSNVILKGTKKLFSRGLDIYEEIMGNQEIKYKKSEDTIEINGKLKPGYFKIQGNISSQYITGLLFALSLFDEDSTLEIIPPVESKPYIDITLDVLRQFGVYVDVLNNGLLLKIKGNNKYQKGHYVVEGDYSNAAFLECYNYFDGNVTLVGLNPNSYQGDKVYQEAFEKLNSGFQTIDLGNAIDLGPILFTFAGLKHGAHFINTKRLKIKESNRINDLIEELNKIGIEALVSDNEVTIYPTSELKMASFDSHNDHRIAMSLALVLSLVGGNIEGSEAVNKSYPAFYDDLKTIGIGVIEND